VIGRIRRRVALELHLRRVRAERYLWGTVIPYRGWGTTVVGYDPAGDTMVFVKQEARGVLRIAGIVHPTGQPRLPE
jgi:hypothetical protein